MQINNQSLYLSKKASFNMEFKKALQYHQSGQLKKAQEIYERILEINPDHSDSLHLLGVMEFVADDAQSYADIANRLANDKAFKNEIKNRILKGADVLYEDMETVHELESFFERVVKEKIKH